MNMEASAPDQKHRRFEDYLPREGFAEPELTSDRFRAILNDAMPGGEWPDAVIDAVVDELDDHLARANGQFGWSSFNTKRGDLRERLELMRGSLETAAAILASSGDLRGKIDVDLLGFIANVAVEAEPGLTSSAMNRKYAAAHEQIRDMLKELKRGDHYRAEQHRRPGARNVLRPYRRRGPFRCSKPGDTFNDWWRPESRPLRHALRPFGEAPGVVPSITNAVPFLGRLRETHRAQPSLAFDAVVAKI